MKQLTPEEALTALREGKKVERNDRCDTNWFELPRHLTIEALLVRDRKFRLAEPEHPMANMPEGVKVWVGDTSEGLVERFFVKHDAEHSYPYRTSAALDVKGKPLAPAGPRAIAMYCRLAQSDWMPFENGEILFNGQLLPEWVKIKVRWCEDYRYGDSYETTVSHLHASLKEAWSDGLYRIVEQDLPEAE